LNPRLCLAVARYLGPDIDYVLGYDVPGAENRSPMGRFPLLQLADGSALWETDAIICHLSALTGSNLWRRDETQTDMIKWLSFTAYHLMPAGDVHYFERIVRPTFSDQAEDPGVMERTMMNFRESAAIIDAGLKGRHWILGDTISYADFRIATLMPFAERALLPVQDYPEIMRHAAQLNELPFWRDPFAGLA